MLELEQFRRQVAEAAGAQVAQELVSPHTNRDGQVSLFWGVTLVTNLKEKNPWWMKAMRQRAVVSAQLAIGHTHEHKHT